VLIAILTACTPDPPENATFDMSNADALVFVLGQPGIQADVDRIQAGDKLGEMWTYVEIPSSVVDPRTRTVLALRSYGPRLLKTIPPRVPAVA